MRQQFSRKLQIILALRPFPSALGNQVTLYSFRVLFPAGFPMPDFEFFLPREMKKSSSFQPPMRMCKIFFAGRCFPSALALIEELPPVEPPSAGFIVQLFLIPMLIVGAIIGVYALFGLNGLRRAGLANLGVGTSQHQRTPPLAGGDRFGPFAEKSIKTAAKKGNTSPKNPEIAKALLDVLKEQAKQQHP